jgi:hypothetical protein
VSAASTCKFQKADGTTCRATSTPSGFCWFHDPQREQERAEARRKGGKRRRQNPAVLPLIGMEDVPLATVTDVATAIAKTFNDVRKGQVDPKTGNCLGLLAGQLLKALQNSELAVAIEELQRQIAEIKQSGNGNPAQPREAAAGGSDGASPAPDAGPATSAG